MTTHNIDVASTLRQISDAMPSLPPLGESDKELFQACASGDVDQVRSLLADGADANAKQPTTRTSVLMAAADLGNAGVAAELLATRSAKGKAKNAVLIRDRDVRGRNAFMVAAEAGHLDILKMILDSFDEMDDPVETTEDGSPPDERVDYVDEQDYQGRTALMLACRGPEDRVIEVVNWLLSDEGGNAAINLQDADGRTALMFAAERCHEALIDLLLAQPQCDVKITANGGFTAGVMAAVNGRPDLARKLISIQKEQEAAADREKKEENLGRSKGKPPRKKKIEAEAAQASPAPAQGSSSATVSFANASASEHRGKTFRVLCRPPSSLDAGTPAERKATRIRSAIREARTVAQSVGEELGWSNGEVVSVEEVARKSDGSVPGEELEVAVTFAF